MVKAVRPNAVMASMSSVASTRDRSASAACSRNCASSEAAQAMSSLGEVDELRERATVLVIGIPSRRVGVRW